MVRRVRRMHYAGSRNHVGYGPVRASRSLRPVPWEPSTCCSLETVARWKQWISSDGSRHREPERSRRETVQRRLARWAGKNCHCPELQVDRDAALIPPMALAG